MAAKSSVQGSAAAALLVLCLGLLGGCGGSGPTTTNMSTTASAGSQALGPEATRPKAAPSSEENGTNTSSGKGKGGSASEAAIPAKLKRKAGGAAPFLVSRGDNSIPTYGIESSASRRTQAESDLRSYLEARTVGDWGAACAQMAATVQKQLALLAQASGGKQASCAAAYAKLAAKIPAAAAGTDPLSALRVKGDKAFALFYGPRRQKYMMPMVSEGGAWKVNQLEPIPYPPGAPAASGE
jgi:hypothetical protein